MEIYKNESNLCLETFMTTTEQANAPLSQMSYVNDHLARFFTKDSQSVLRIVFRDYSHSTLTTRKTEF